MITKESVAKNFRGEEVKRSSFRIFSARSILEDSRRVFGLTRGLGNGSEERRLSNKLDEDV